MTYLGIWMRSKEEGLNDTKESEEMKVGETGKGE